MKILVISRSLFSNNPQSVRFRNFVENWKLKHQISLITFEDNILSDAQSLNMRVNVITVRKGFISRKIAGSLKKDKAQHSETSKKKLHTVIKFFNYRKLFFPDVYIFTIRNIKNTIVKLIDINEFDLIVVSGFPFSFQILGKYLRNKMTFRNILVYDTGDPFYKNSSKTTQGILHRSFSKLFERNYLKYFDFLCVPSVVLRKHYIEQFPLLFKKVNIILIPQGIQSEMVFNAKREVISSRESLDKRSTKLVYAGSFYKKLRDPNILFEAIRSSEFIKLIIYGKVNNDFYSESNNIVFCGEIENNKVVKAYKENDIIVFLDNSEGIQVPGKVYEILACRMPILFIYSNENSPALEIMREYGCVFKTKNNVTEILDTIKRIIKFKDQIVYNFNPDNFTWNVLAKKYITEINNL